MKIDPFLPRDQVHAKALIDLLDKDGSVYLGTVRQSVAGVQPGFLLFEPDNPMVPLSDGFRTEEEAVAAVTEFLTQVGKVPRILWLPPPEYYAA